MLYPHTYIHKHCKHNYRPGQVKLKPVVVHDYNQGVDKLDQIASYYSFLHKSVKWWRKVFFWLLEVAVINAFIIHKKLEADEAYSFSQSSDLSPPTHTTS